MRSRALKTILAIVTMMVLLAGCGESKQNAGSAPAASVPAAEIYDMVAKKANGFTVGSMMAAKVVYVFFDAQCPHCAVLWRESKPILGKVRMVWIPVRLQEISAVQGAMILSAADPAAAMDQHEKLRDSGGKGLEPKPDVPKEPLDRVRANTELWTSIGAEGVPHIVYKNPVNGTSSVFEGQMDTQSLEKLLGI